MQLLYHKFAALTRMCRMCDNLDANLINKSWISYEYIVKMNIFHFFLNLISIAP